MAAEETIPTLTYDAIIAEAKSFSSARKTNLPSLPAAEDLEPYIGVMHAKDRRLVDEVRRHIDDWGSAHGHGFEEHIEFVAAMGSYIANSECEERGIRGDLRGEIIRRAWRLGLTHDMQRWRGYQKIHAEEGMRAARQKLEELGIADDELLLDQILIHDDLSVPPRGDVRFDIPYYSVFAADHLNWGKEWEETRWRGLAKNKIDPRSAIHDYKFMYSLLEGGNFEQTKFGREVAVPHVQFGIDIAKHIENTFAK